MIKLNRRLQIKAKYNNNQVGIKSAVQLSHNKHYIVILEMRNVLKILNVETMEVITKLEIAMVANSKIRILYADNSEYYIMLMMGLYVMVYKFNVFHHSFDLVHRLKQLGDTFDALPSPNNRNEIYSVTTFHVFTLQNIKSGTKIYDLPLTTTKSIYIQQFFPLYKLKLLCEVTKESLVIYNFNNLKNYKVFKFDQLFPDETYIEEWLEKFQLIKTIEYRNHFVIVCKLGVTRMGFISISYDDLGRYQQQRNQPVQQQQQQSQQQVMNQINEQV